MWGHTYVEPIDGIVVVGHFFLFCHVPYGRHFVAHDLRRVNVIFFIMLNPGCVRMVSYVRSLDVHGI